MRSSRNGQELYPFEAGHPRTKFAPEKIVPAARGGMMAKGKDWCVWLPNARRKSKWQKLSALFFRKHDAEETATAFEVMDGARPIVLPVGQRPKKGRRG